MSAPSSGQRLTPDAYLRMRTALSVMQAARRRHGEGMVPPLMALEAAGLLQSPEAAAELAELRARVAARPEHELGAEWAERLTAMRARAEAATPGPWGTYDDGTGRLDIVAGLVETGTGYTGRRQIAQTVESPMDNDPAHADWDEDEDVAQCQADGEFVAAARTDVSALLDLLDQALSVLRQHQDWHARDAMRMRELEADASTHVPELRESVRGWSDRCRAAEAEANVLRIRNAELGARSEPTTTWFLADSEGAEGGPTLHATLDAAQAWCDGFEAADWVEQDGVWVQCICDPDTDRPTGRGAGTVTPLTVPAAAEVEQLRERVAVLEAALEAAGRSLSPFGGGDPVADALGAQWLRQQAMPNAEQGAAPLSESQQAMLVFALDLAGDRMASEDGFTADDEAALASLRRLAAGGAS